MDKIDELFNSLREGLAKTENFLKSELSSIRTGRASTALIEGVRVEAYGSLSPLSALAGITMPEANQFVVEPWDKSLLKPLEEALKAADLGLSINNEGSKLRLILPPLTAERREELIKLSSQKAEEAKVSIRNVRRDIFEELEKLETDVGEEAVRRAEKRFQELVDEANEKIDGLLKQKENEIKEI